MVGMSKTVGEEAARGRQRGEGEGRQRDKSGEKAEEK